MEAKRSIPRAPFANTFPLLLTSTVTFAGFGCFPASEMAAGNGRIDADKSTVGLATGVDTAAASRSIAAPSSSGRFRGRSCAKRLSKEVLKSRRASRASMTV